MEQSSERKNRRSRLRMGTGKKWGGGSCFAAWFVLAVLCWVGGEGVKLGVLLDPNSTVGKLCNTSIQLALSDLYTANPQYKTRIIPLFKNAGDIVGVASAGNFFGTLSILLSLTKKCLTRRYSII